MAAGRRAAYGEGGIAGIEDAGGAKIDSIIQLDTAGELDRPVGSA